MSNKTCQVDVAMEVVKLQTKYRDLANENLRMRHLMQKDTVEIAKLKLEIERLTKELSKCTTDTQS